MCHTRCCEPCVDRDSASLTARASGMTCALFAAMNHVRRSGALLLCAALLVTSIFGACSGVAPVTTQVTGAGAGGDSQAPIASGGSRTQAGAGATIQNQVGGADGCSSPPPQCFGQDSTRCCNNDPGLPECVDGHWSCYGFPAPGCNGDLCADLFECGPRLTCVSTREFCRVTVVAGSGTSGEGGAAARIGDAAAGEGGLGGIATVGDGVSSQYECVPFPLKCRLDHSCTCLAEAECQMCMGDLDRITEQCSGH